MASEAEQCNCAHNVNTYPSKQRSMDLTVAVIYYLQRADGLGQDCRYRRFHPCTQEGEDILVSIRSLIQMSVDQ